jgi:hypothetical protein
VVGFAAAGELSKIKLLVSSRWADSIDEALLVSGDMSLVGVGGMPM